MKDLKNKVAVADPTILKKLRGIVQPPTKRGTWLRHLNDEQLLEVYFRLKDKQSTYHICQMAQKQWKVMPKSDTRSLCRAVRELREGSLGLIAAYRESFPKTEEKKNFADKQKERAERIVKDVDGMEELRWLLKTMKGRIRGQLEGEQVGGPSLDTDKSLNNYLKALNVYLEHMEELGLITRVPREVDVNLKADFEMMMGTLIPDGGNRMIVAATKFLELAKQKAIPLKRGESGVYEMKGEGDGQKDREQDLEDGDGEVADSEVDAA